MGGSLGALTLVQTLTASATSSITFSGLNGNNDYLYFATGTVSMTTINTRLQWVPNGNISSNQRNSYRYVGNTGGSGASGDSGGLLMGREVGGTLSNPAATVSFFVWFHASTQSWRGYSGLSCEIRPDAGSPNLSQIVGGGWQEMSTNMTSLKLQVTGGTMTGTVSLYKLAVT